MLLTHENKKDILFVYFPETIRDIDFDSLSVEFDIIEKEYIIYPNRLISLCKIKSFNAHFNSILHLAEKRNKKEYPNKFKTALLVNDNIQLGFARMFQTFIETPQIEIEIFRDETKAINWLKSDNTRLTRYGGKS